MKIIIWRTLQLAAIWDFCVLIWKLLKVIDDDRKARPGDVMTLGPHSSMIWARFLYEEVSGYGPGELSHWYNEADRS